MSYKKWVIANADKERASEISEKLNIDPFIAFLLVARGVSDDLGLNEFIFGTDRLVNPFSFTDMDKAVNRINNAIASYEKICVYGDFDADGVTSTALLFTFLESMGADVQYYIPKRESEGYGLNSSALHKIAENGTKLIITVDNGISAVEEADEIYNLGMELVITDHHQIPSALPRAEAIVNPHRDDGKVFADYAGVGVAFKLISALYDGDISELIDSYADLVAIGTIGDIVPLVNENRELVKAGINSINNSSRIGIEAFKEITSNQEKQFSSTDVAFQIVPRINVAGRLDDADKAIKMLISDDYSEALFLAEQLNTENAHRQELEKNILCDIKEKISKNPNITKNRVVVISGKNYHPGVIGIVASHVVSEYGKPAIILSDDDSGELKGSCRSIEGFNIYEALNACKNDLTKFGGHPLAAGLGLKADNLQAFIKNINNFAKTKYKHMPPQELKLDCKLSAYYLNLDLVDNLAILEPYGANNPQAVFGLFNFTLVSVTGMGDNKHIRIEIEKKNQKFKVVNFKTSPNDFPYAIGDKIDIAVKLSKNFFKGRNYLSVQAVDVRLNSNNDDLYFAQKDDYENFENGDPPNSVAMPTREQCVFVYKYIKSIKIDSLKFDDLYFRIQNNKISYGTLKYIISAFYECGLIENSEKITPAKVNEKKDLFGSKALISLKGKLQNG